MITTNDIIQAVENLISNEDRLNTFVNKEGYFVTAENEQVATLKTLIEQWTQIVNTEIPVAELIEILTNLQENTIKISDIATQSDITAATTGKVVDAAGLKAAGITAAAIGTIDGKNGGYLNDDQYIRLRNVRTVNNGMLTHKRFEQLTGGLN